MEIFAFQNWLVGRTALPNVFRNDLIAGEVLFGEGVSDITSLWEFKQPMGKFCWWIPFGFVTIVGVGLFILLGTVMAF